MIIAINGAGIAGPTLAYWLRKAGHEVLLVEQSPQLRRGGYIIDFWGIGYDIAEKMGLLPQIMDLGYQVREVRFVRADGRYSGGFSTAVFHRLTDNRFTSLQRSDLAAAIYGTLDDGVETIFGDSIAHIEQRDDGVRIDFDHAPPRDVDLIIGADGMHSRIRQLAFSAPKEYELSLGYHVAAFEVEGYRPRDELVYVSHTVAGKQVSRFSLRDDKTLNLFVFHDRYLRDGANGRQPRSVLADVFADVGWECPRILDAMNGADDIYFDRVSQIRMDSWATGRVALIGDAAACVSLLAGEGTGIAMAAAYTLAGELHRCRGDYRKAFARYQQRMLPFLRRKQIAAAKFASAFAPTTAVGVAVRNLFTRLLQVGPIADRYVGGVIRDDISLPDYGL